MNEAEKELAKALNIDNLDEDQQKSLLEKYGETLVVRIGMALQSALSESQLEVFAKVQTEQGDSAVQPWLEKTLPNYYQILEAEERVLQADIKRSIEEIGVAVQKGFDVAKDE